MGAKMAMSLGEYQDVFLEEAEEQIDTLNTSLLELEKNYDDLSYINEIFRAAHSLKSSAAFVGLTQLSDMAHHMESLLQQVRDGQRKINSQIIDVLFRCFDVIRTVVDLASRGENPEIDMQAILAEIKRVAQAKDEPAKATSSAKPKAALEVSDNGTSADNGLTDDDEWEESAVNVGKQAQNNKKPQLLTKDERKIISEGLKDDLRCYDLTMHFEEETPALWMRIHLVSQQLENLGSIIKTLPDKEKIDENFSGNKIKVILLTAEDEQAVFNTADVDQIEKIEIKEIRLKDKKNASSAPQTSQTKSVSTASQQKEASSEDVESSHDLESPNSQTATDSDSGAAQNSAVQTVHQSMEDLTKSISQTVKVPVKKLDELLNNVAELVIANSGFMRIYDEIRNQFGNTNVSSEFKNRIEQMNRIAKDLQSGIMNTRMIPIGSVFKRFNRLVRDLSKEFGKEINLVLKGEETELDKKVIDSLGEPLLHLIRNSVDHGLENGADRESLGKDRTGTIMLNAYQGGNRIVVEVVDDGRGLNVDRIKKKAINRNLINQTQMETMTNDDLYQLIFLPGFSTAEKVTDVSGRGVGMNVVKEVVTMMNGNVVVETEEGVGTKFTMTFPLTTAIIAAIMVRTGQDLYAVPLSDVVETIKVSDEEISTIENHEVIYLRDDILSLVRLNKALGLGEEKTDNRKKLPVVVVGYGTRKVGLVVDKLEGKQEIVIKSLEQNFRAIEGLSGASILGDGSIALILDVQSMINLSINNSMKLEEQRFKKRIQSQNQNDKDRMSAEDYFKNFGQQKDAPEPTVPEPAKMDTENASTKSNVSKQEPKQEANKKPSIDQKSDPKKSAESEYRSMDSSEKVESSKPKQTDSIEKENVQEKNTSKDSDQESELIQQIRKEANENILNSARQGGVDSMLLKPEELENLHTKSAQAAKNAGFSDQDMENILTLSNQGITRAAESLSQIVNKKVEMTIPDINMMPVEMLGQDEQFNEEPSVSVILKMDGDLQGHFLLSLNEQDANMMVDLLYGLETGNTKELNEDAESGLKEVTNIVGSGLLNSIGQDLELSITPSVPELSHDFFSSTFDTIVIEHASESDYALVLNTEFFISENAIMGRIFLLPKHSSIKRILEKLQQKKK